MKLKFNIWPFRHRITKKTAMLFFSNDTACPCHAAYLNFLQSKNSNIVLIDSVYNLDLQKYSEYENIIVFAHGDSDSLRCFLRSKKTNRSDEVYIDNTHWYPTFSIKGNILFNVCHGSGIIDNMKHYRKVWMKWVSYKSEINWFDHSDERVKKLITEYSSRLVADIEASRSPHAYFHAIKSSYHHLISKIIDKNTGRPLKGYEYILHLICENIDNLEHSV